MEFGKGWLFPPEQSETRDPKTGVRVRRLTGYPCCNHLPCRNPFTPEGDALIFVSWRDGAPQLFELSLAGGRIRQLTEGPAVHPFSLAVHHGGERIFFVRGGSIWVLHRTTLEESCVVSLGQTRLGECALAGDWLAAAARQGEQYGLVVGRTDGTRWDFLPIPRPVLAPQFHPLEPEWIEFASRPAPRMHRIRRDGAGLECLYRHAEQECILHETFLGQTGDLIFALRPQALCRMDWESRRIRTLARLSAWRPGSNRAGTLAVCDTHQPNEGIFLVDPVTGGRQLVCLPESSHRIPHAEAVEADTPAELEWDHPHPCFSPDGRRIAFTSDSTGRPQICLAELDDLASPIFGGPLM
jgi:oligogalacturonide lyase